MSPIYEQSVQLEIKVQDSVEETEQAIETALRQRGRRATWAVIDVDVDRQTLVVAAVVVDESHFVP
ncbi:MULTISPECIES: hypothetical protein [Leptolyngbya]|uniref:hypothetical protein n=1 Tax=Leptolyngbya TaxID=47251 RepID=UPI00168946D9|nr:hypothetical protein [Leptolyngbya sp. FACHB-1624]MBD1854549.1 hypothetical protein [Leptolyngbya sp. FACHB-1624]